MIKAFLDCGAHDGRSVETFKARTPDWREFEIHCFEPNPIFRDGLRALARVTFHEAAVWVEVGSKPLYQHLEGKLKASSLLSCKQDLNLSDPIMVFCVDFGSWVKRHFQRDDYIVVKMDIEGAEYRVLSQMIADGSIGYVNELYVEFHHHKVGVTREFHENLVDDLTAIGLAPKVWHTA